MMKNSQVEITSGVPQGLLLEKRSTEVETVSNAANLGVKIKTIGDQVLISKSKLKLSKV